MTFATITKLKPLSMNITIIYILCSSFIKLIEFTLIFSIRSLPAMAFENLNSLENLNLQNNKLIRIQEEIMEPIMDTLRVVDITGKQF